MRKMIQVNVTKLDIQRGVQGSPTSCPVARAVRRAIKIKRANNRDNSVYVRPCGVLIVEGKRYFHFYDRTSKTRDFSLERFVQTFDDGRKLADSKPCKLFLVQPS